MLQRVKYRVILADPPWKWKAWSKKGLGRSAAAHYQTLDLNVLIQMGPQVRELADEDCVLFMWRLNSMEEEAHELLKAWGFKFKTLGFTWNKQTKNDRGDNFGMGFWTHQSTEEVMVGFRGNAMEDVALALDMPEQQDVMFATRGHPKRVSKKLRQVIYAPIREHSRKPDEIYDAIEALMGPGPYVELFARASRPGWDVKISNQAGKLDRPEVRTRCLPSSLVGITLETIDALLDGRMVLTESGLIVPASQATAPIVVESTFEPVSAEPVKPTLVASEPSPEPPGSIPDPAPPGSAPAPEPTPEPVESTSRPARIVTLIPKAEGVTRFLYRDFETQSKVDVRKVGARNYVAHPSTKVFCCAYALNDSLVQVWWPGDPVPPEFLPENHDAKVGHNSDQFDARVEREILGPRLGWPQADVPEYDTMVMGARIGLPQKLSTLAVALNLEVRKDAEGRRLMLEFARQPDRVPTPEERAALEAYAATDVTVTREAFRKLWRWNKTVTATERAIYPLSNKINTTGFHVDLELARAELRVVERAAIALDFEIGQLTHHAVDTVNQRDRLIAWLETQGIKVKGLQADKVDGLLDRPDLPPVVREVLELRRSGAQAASRKLTALLNGVSPDGRVRDAFRYHGAAPGRWSGAQFQPQNLKHPEIEDLDAAIAVVRTGDYHAVKARYPRPLSVVGDLSRSLIMAEPGRYLVGGDFSAIESIVTAWLSGESWKLQAYRDYFDSKDPAKEPYSVIACKLLGLPPGSVTKADKAKRKIGKTADLAFGFGGGEGAWRRLDDSNLTEEQIKNKRQSWRMLHPATQRFWKKIEASARAALQQPDKSISCGRLTFCYVSNANLLIMRLPSGRIIGYPDPRLVDSEFEGAPPCVNAKKLRPKGGWTECRLWHGLLIENAVQATARDILAEAMLHLDAAEFKIVSHVHDEVMVEVKADEVDVAKFEQLMRTPPAWAPDIPLFVEAWVSERFDKRLPPNWTPPTRQVQKTLAAQAQTASPANWDDHDGDDLPAHLAELKTRVSLVDIVGEDKVTCPFHDDHNPSCQIYPDGFKCFSCGAHGDHFDWLQGQAMINGEEVETLVRSADAMRFGEAISYLENWERNTPPRGPVTNLNVERRRRADQIWRQSGRLLDSPLALRYLTVERGLDVSKLPESIHDVLRFHSACPWGPDAQHPAIVALFRDVITDEPIGIHRIAIPDGKKLERKMLGGGPRSRAVKLQALNSSTILFVGEGIETVLAAMLHIPYRGQPITPAWAMGSAGAIANLPVIDGVQQLVVLVDNDANGIGRKSAEVCAKIWWAAGRHVNFFSPKGLKDFNDVVLKLNSKLQAPNSEQNTRAALTEGGGDGRQQL
jgi:DNA polymerase